ncbi:hypothetical protein [Photobacterium lutimaris]|uniref:Carboxypeptidase regulatory-like domain-containing protein n=1 Tax=Photobacterium lutimaris TaxID=388278 RepID=A0A2T3IZZ7_9GAMM|nr:hypothetical protein [Photobacterium lutimaris]PSU34250.1 hypothetical protein C9I99_09710 [Photobacterium lutimaris]TDR75837.1 hypothetical protein DFP78_104199 [Photobacterium lutimaris]
MLKLTGTMIAATVLLSSPVMADLNLDVTPQNEGAWVKVSENGAPASNVTITTNVPGTGSFTTDEHGRAYVTIASNRSGSVKFRAMDVEGNLAYKSALISKDK